MSGQRSDFLKIKRNEKNRSIEKETKKTKKVLFRVFQLLRNGVYISCSK